MARVVIMTFCATVLFMAAEFAARTAIDIKIYGSDSGVGYLLLPNQSVGTFLVGSYAINSEGFAVSQAVGLDKCEGD